MLAILYGCGTRPGSQTLPHGTRVRGSKSAGDVMRDGSEGRAVWLSQPWRLVVLASRATAVPARGSQARPA